MADIEKPITILFYGPSGSGKGTQARLLQEHLRRRDPLRECEYIETGSLVREFQEGAGYTRELVQEAVGGGGLLPSFVPIYLWTKYFVERFEGVEHVILDGLARRRHEVDALEEALRFYGRDDYRIISFILSDASVRDRLRSRHRDDDMNDKAIEKKIGWYQTEVVSALERFKELAAAIDEVDAEPSIDEIHANIVRILGLT
jgi:adenylate kinase family enzyme